MKSYDQIKIRIFYLKGENNKKNVSWVYRASWVRLDLLCSIYSSDRRIENKTI